MHSVRTAVAASVRVLHRELCPLGTRATAVARQTDPLCGTSGVLVLDVIYLATTLALFALVGLIAKGMEEL